MNKARPIITIDGPAASGKGTISKNIANKFNLYNLETGLFYRVLGKEFLKYDENIKINNFLSYLSKVNFNLDERKKKEIYTEEVAEKASKLAKLIEVRKFVLIKQLKIIKDYSKIYKGLILEGRDCGTVIVPKANVKLFLTAKVEERAKRRYQQLLSNGKSLKYNEVLEDLMLRDKNDISREHSPLIMARDAIQIDCSSKSIKETIMIVKKIIFSKLPYFK